MKLSLKDCQKVSSDKHSTTLKHPDGHEIKVAHKGLSPKMKGELESLSQTKDKPIKMAEGGRVSADFPKLLEDEQKRLGVNAGLPISLNPMDQMMLPKEALEPFKQEAETTAAAKDLAIQESTKAKAVSDYAAQMQKVQSDNAIRQQAGLPLISPPDAPALLSDAQAVTQAPQMEMPQQVPQQAMPAMGAGGKDPFGNEAYLGNYMAGMQKEKAGIQAQADAEAKRAQEEEIALQRDARDRQVLQQYYQETFSALNKERESLMADAMKGHINPNQFWEDKSAPSKISTAIGLILGGIGSGFARSETNPALEMLQKQIDRNIDAQKINLSNKFSLLNANRQSLDNENDAVNMTRVMTNDYIANQLKLAAAKTTDPMAQARAQQLIGKLQMESAPVLQQIAMRKAMTSGMASGQISPESMIRFSPFIPEGEKQAAFKELEEAHGLIKAKDNIMASFDKIAKINTLGNRLTSPLQTRQQVAAIRDPLIASLSKDTAGRFSEADAQFLAPLFPEVGDSDKTVALKRAQVNKIISKNMNFPRLKSIGIDPTKHARFGSSGQGQIQESAPVVK